ncbi:dihydrolipoamide acetyltransferase family protein [Sphingomonas oligophenolica]|uniref:Dihydrolipoamide acetyltransferase component of pyruvate dehydrogenase complex n=1 Tax=Sphingomonas oligophenolica TaxID=301154 RepID=A0ABU9Y8T2_9SPHN
MTSYSFKLPDIGEGIAEAEVVRWYAQVGDIVEEDALLADLMTDKATVEMTSPVSGRITRLACEVGKMVAIGSILAVLETDSEPPALPSEGGTIAATLDDRGPSPELSLTARDEPEMHLALPPASVEQRRILASPAVRERARNLGVDLAEVATGEPGRIRHADLDAFLSYNARSGYRAVGARRPDEQVKVIGLRRRIAENMAASKRAIPHFTYVDEIDVTKLEALRADLNETRGARPKLTTLPLIISALCRAVPDFPMMNARYDDESGVVTRHGAVHLGMATQTAAGLTVPVIRDAQDRNIWQLAREIGRLATAARDGTATSAELSGSTLTITSLGPLGGIVTTPVINRPEVAILGPNKIVERPVVRGGSLEVAKMMNLSVSCDHRVVDGWDAASFVQALKALLETPAALFS